MIIGIRSGLVHDRHSLLVELHKVALERQIAYSRLVLFAITPVVLEK